ncbi:MAG: N-acetylneuraminate synthase [Oribacterium sp.]|nr:N-acetylneuraminate synthase [Oribacterium sp.]
MEKTLIIAEIGVNHNGSIDLAKQMIEVAKGCGADIVKFQTFNVDAITSKSAEMAQYQKENLGEEKSQKEMLSSLALSHSDFKELAECCKKIGIKFLSTPFDIESVRFLNNLQDMWKIPSGEITNYPYLVEIARTKKKIILSTGMSTIEEVDDALKVLRENGAGDVVLLHCTTDYPAPIDTVNLEAMLALRERFDCPVGYSDHTKGIEVSIAAVAMGATVIEKHLTLDKTMSGPDHKASLEPNELKELIVAIRNVEKARGIREKKPTESEVRNRSVVRKSIVALKPIHKGEIFSTDNLTTKRPGTGISPMKWNEIIGTIAERDYKEDELI